jgi:hypothetical protein
VVVLATGRKRAAVFMCWNMEVPLEARKSVDVIIRTENWVPVRRNLGQNQKSNA